MSNTISNETRNRLIVPLDVPTTAEASNIVKTLGDTVSFYKIGYQLTFAGGLELTTELLQDGKHVFLDMKLLDIDNTIAKAVENIVRMGVDMLTLHAYPKAMKAAVDASKGSNLCLLGVTVLTSMDDADLVDTGYSHTAGDLVLKRAKQASNAGMGGVVASAMEARAIREVVGSNMAIVTPGIRPAGSAANDQKRIMTPFDAISAGASHLVVGRPIIAADEPKATAQAILEEISSV